MNNIKNSRQSVDDKLKSMGYVHPENPKSLTTSVYKSFDEEKKIYKKNNYSSYSTMNYSLLCPECNEKALYKCDCVIGELLCKNNHMWYTEKTGIIVLGDPHKK